MKTSPHRSASSTISVIYLSNALLQAAVVLIFVVPRYGILHHKLYFLEVIRWPSGSLLAPRGKITHNEHRSRRCRVCGPVPCPDRKSEGSSG